MTAPVDDGTEPSTIAEGLGHPETPARTGSGDTAENPPEPGEWSTLESTERPEIRFIDSDERELAFFPSAIVSIGFVPALAPNGPARFTISLIDGTELECFFGSHTARRAESELLERMRAEGRAQAHALPGLVIREVEADPVWQDDDEDEDCECECGCG